MSSSRTLETLKKYREFIEGEHPVDDLNIFNNGCKLVLVKETGWSKCFVDHPFAVIDPQTKRICLNHFIGFGIDDKFEKYIELTREDYLNYFNSVGHEIITTEYGTV